MRARFYNQDLRRFVNIDPLRNGTNWYAYANGNPISNVDPTGTFAITTVAATLAIGTVAGAIGGAIGAAISGKRGKDILGAAVKGGVGGAVGALGTIAVASTAMFLGMTGAVAAAFTTVIGGGVSSVATAYVSSAFSG